jgi:hypothetical protein
MHITGDSLFQVCLALVAVVYGLLTMRVFDLEAKKATRTELKSVDDGVHKEIDLILKQHKEILKLNREQTHILRGLDRVRRSEFPSSHEFKLDEPSDDEDP